MLGVCLHRLDSDWIPSQPRRAQHSLMICSEDEWIGWCRSQTGASRCCLVEIVSTGIRKKEKVSKKTDVHSAVCGIRDGLPIEERIEIRTNDRIDQWITRHQSREDQDDRYGYKRGFHIFVLAFTTSGEGGIEKFSRRWQRKRGNRNRICLWSLSLSLYPRQFQSHIISCKNPRENKERRIGCRPIVITNWDCCRAHYLLCQEDFNRKGAWSSGLSWRKPGKEREKRMRISVSIRERALKRWKSTEQGEMSHS